MSVIKPVCIYVLVSQCIKETKKEEEIKYENRDVIAIVKTSVSAIAKMTMVRHGLCCFYPPHHSVLPLKSHSGRLRSREPSADRKLEESSPTARCMRYDCGARHILAANSQKYLMLIGMLLLVLE